VGGTGGGGSGGTGGLPACTTDSAATGVVSVAIVGSDGKAIETAISAAVTVTSVDSCTTVSCASSLPSSLLPTDPMTSRIGLTASAGGSWTLYLRNSAMPSDYIKVGDTFDLTVDAALNQTLYGTVDQTVVLARNGDLLVFAASLQRFYRLALPDLRAFDTAVLDEGAFCQSPSFFGCIPRPHTTARVSMATDASILLRPGETGRIGDLSFTNGEFTELADTGNCDSKSRTQIAAFKLP
jgi:hypothetical protein